MSQGRLWWWLRLAVISALGVWVLWSLLAGPSGPFELPRARPARSYEDASDLFGYVAVKEATSPEVNPVCRSRLLTHGRKTAQAVVLLHGFTNCPRQFEELGSMLYTAGANVLLPRIPHHGLRDRMTRDLARLTEDEMMETAVWALDVAHGLGDTVTVVGLSTMAVAVAALAERRSDLARAVLLAPALVPRGVPAPLGRPLATLMIGAPNQFIWWDSKAKESLGGPAQCYLRFPTHPLGRVYRLGALVREEAGRKSPAARSIVVITTKSDVAVDNGATAELVRRWRQHRASVIEYQFPESLQVLHDMIDPEQVGARTNVVYPVLAALALGRPLP